MQLFGQINMTFFRAGFVMVGIQPFASCRNLPKIFWSLEIANNILERFFAPMWLSITLCDYTFLRIFTHRTRWLIQNFTIPNRFAGLNFYFSDGSLWIQTFSLKCHRLLYSLGHRQKIKINTLNKSFRLFDMPMATSTLIATIIN